MLLKQLLSFFFFFKQKTAYEIGTGDWSSDVCLPISRPAEIYQLTLLPEQSTSVPRGENRGVHLFSRNVVLDAVQIGTYSGEAQSVEIDAPSVGHSCAIIIQEKRGNRLGPILGASYCS